MGIFGRKKEKAKSEVINISGIQLCDLLKNAVSLAIEDKYDKKRAKAEKKDTFSNDLMTIYLDRQSFDSVENLYIDAVLDKEHFSDISKGIIVSSEYKELL